ncbi:MAG: hypothetical protein V4657_11440 [Pseudomonadota bacterium]
MAKTKRQRKPKADNRLPPTPEQAARSEYASAGMAYRRIAVIDTMLSRGQLTDREFVLLDYYRQQASLADRSPLKSCIDFSVKGGDMAPSAAITSALLETARIERDMLSCWPIARAVAVDDISLTEWCIRKFGGRERYDGKGRFIAMVPVRERNVIGEALRELKTAARRIVK